MRKPTDTAEGPGRPRADPDRDARAMLLAAATELFADHGIAATSFSTIAKRAGMTPAMMHYYFKDRDQLLDAVVSERLVPFIAYVWDPVEPGDSPVDSMVGIVRRLLSGISQSPWVPNTWMREILNESGLLRQKVLRHIPVEKVRLIGQAIRAGQTSGKLNPELDPLLYVFSAVGLSMLHMATIKVWGEIFHRPSPSLDAMQRHITALLLDGLRNSSPTTLSNQRSQRTPRRQP